MAAMWMSQEKKSNIQNRIYAEKEAEEIRI